MKTPPIVYGLTALLILGGVLFFASHQPAHAPTENSDTSAPNTPKPSQSAVSVYGTVNTKMGSQIQFADFVLKPLSVETDSRCPMDVTCVWAGTLKLKVLLTSSKGNSTEVIEIGKPFSYDSSVITLVSSVPAPTASMPIAQSDYAFTFSVSKTKPTSGVPPPVQCYVGGCSSQICSDRPDVASTCIFKEEYACYAKATCERQSAGECGWTSTKALSQCVQSAQSVTSENLPQ